MSILKVHNKKLRLSKTQQAMLERSLRDLVVTAPNSAPQSWTKGSGAGAGSGNCWKQK
jgi:hypothetical protein